MFTITGWESLLISFGINGDRIGETNRRQITTPISRRLYKRAYYAGESLGKKGRTIIPAYPPKNKGYPQVFPQRVSSIICITGFSVKKPAIYLRKL